MTSNDRPEEPSIEDIQKLLARMAPPETVLAAVDINPEIPLVLAQLSPEKSVELYAGLMTDPRFQAHTTRFDWAIRCILGYARGRRRPKEPDVSRFLNGALVAARIARLEDPIEDFFTESLPTRSGDFLLISGYWEKAALHTETVLSAFADLPDAPIKEASLRRAFALLKLSTAVVERAGLERRIVGGGEPNGTIQVPSDQRLSTLAKRVRFDWAELDALGIDRKDLAPFVLSAHDAAAIISSVPGDSPLEFRPLLERADGITVAAPANLSTAIRSHLIDVAVKLGMGSRLHFNLLRTQAYLLKQGNVDLGGLPPIRRTADHYYCESTHELSAGRHVHVIHSVAGFEGWPDRAFGSVTPARPEWQDTIFKSIREERARVSALPNFAEGITIWFAGGWGAGHSFGVPQEEHDAEWPLLVLDPGDAVLLNACNDAKTSDLWRLQKLIEAVETQGFDFVNFSGFLNMFGWWKTTEHALVPSQQIDIAPPTVINFDSNLILDVRKEGSQALDRRAVQHPSGEWHFVAKLERGAMGSVFPLAYGSLDQALSGNFLGVCLSGRFSWWIELTPESGTSRDAFETWRAVLMWVSKTLPAFLASVKSKQIIANLRFVLQIPEMPQGGNSILQVTLSDEEIDSGIALEVSRETSSATITLSRSWFQGFYRPDNYAEVSLATKVLFGASQIFCREDPEPALRSIVSAVAGSPDFRHRHAFEAESAVERLAAVGLTKGFRRIPISAGALVKCGSAWPSHPRSLGLVIEGKDDCAALIQAFGAERQQALLQEVRKYNRRALIVAALDGFQAAVASERHWARSARALRAIHGIEGDFRESLENSSAANGVIRANSLLLEMAASEASHQDGRSPGLMDVEELQARALQLFYAGDMLPAFLAERVDSTIHISPTGDLLYEHEFEQIALRASAELRHARTRVWASDDYLERFEERAEGKHHFDLEQTVEAEYGISAGYVRGFPHYLVDICRARNEGVLILSRSDLLQALNSFDYLSGQDFRRLIDRLTMPSRSGWDDLLPGMKPGDLDVAKFDRRYSPISRPIISLDAGDNPMLAIAPSIVERALSHNISGAYSGALQNEFWQSDEMRRYASMRGAASGLEFNEEVARSVEKLGLRAWPSKSLSDCLNQQNTIDLKQLGDLDVLVITPTGEHAWVIEAKDLKLCRTLGEAARRLSGYRGVPLRNGKPDALMRHLQRVAYVRRNVDALQKRMKLPTRPLVHGVLVVNAPQPMQQLRREYSEDSTTVMSDDLATVPWDKGWR
jgi:hypothetical protein